MKYKSIDSMKYKNTEFPSTLRHYFFRLTVYPFENKLGKYTLRLRTLSKQSANFGTTTTFTITKQHQHRQYLSQYCQ